MNIKDLDNLKKELDKIDLRFQMNALIKLRSIHSLSEDDYFKLLEHIS